MKFGIILYACFISLAALAEAPLVGRKPAQKFFNNVQPVVGEYKDSRMLMLHFGTFTSTESWDWEATGKRTDISAQTYGVTYMVSEWTPSVDFNVRFDFTDYVIDEYKPLRMSVLGLATFPDIEARFPLYFGMGLGPGFYFRQVPARSNVSLDFQLVAGGRWLEAFGTTGFFVEGGLKNHLHILSTGQFNGVFLSGGAVFTF